MSSLELKSIKCFIYFVQHLKLDKRNLKLTVFVPLSQVLSEGTQEGQQSPDKIV